jgi:hypothetical protein
MSAGENFKFIFREAKINDAILFFDECEAIFESREKGTHDVNMLLTEVERYIHYSLKVCENGVFMHAESIRSLSEIIVLTTYFQT